jgi:hypothetical protein
MTNPNPSPESVKLVASALCRAAGMDPEGGARAGYSWINHETEARALLAALSQPPPPPSLSTDVQSAATGFHEHDVSLKVAMPVVGEVERLRAALAEIDRINGGADWNGTRTIARNALATVAAGDDEGDGE